jgi:spore germination cell wall hydrolase CwlJ-like protein
MVNTSALGTYLIAAFLSQVEPLEVSINDYFCMVEAIHFEANGEQEEGKQLVANVILNRVERINSLDTICDVVHAKYQFSYEKGIKVDLSKEPDLESFKETIEIAYDAVQGNLNDITGGADHYYNPKKIKTVQKWMTAGEQLGMIGNHKMLRLIDENGRWMQ